MEGEGCGTSSLGIVNSNVDAGLEGTTKELKSPFTKL